MKSKNSKKLKVALVFGNLPSAEEVDQFRLLADQVQVSVVSTQSICGYLKETSRFQNLECYALPDHDENPTYVPGLESVLANFDLVIVKERLGLYAYQAVKAKWKHKFRLAIWVDNLAPLPAEDVAQMRTIRSEVVNAADAFLVQSKAAEQALVIEGIDDNRIIQFSPWVEKISKRNKKTRHSALQALGLAENAIVIAHFGQIEWEEGLSDLAAGLKLALQRDAAKAERIRLVFCGIGSYATQFKQTLVALGVDDRAVFVAPNRDAYQTILNAADAVYLASTPSRDRVEGDPYRLVQAMSNEVAIITNRSAIVEEICGKHRIDICFASPASIADGLSKLSRSTALVNDIVKKNASTVRERFSEKRVRTQLDAIVTSIMDRKQVVNSASIDHQVAEAESLVSSKQYLKAIDLIEAVFKIEHIPVHHRANLYRLVGDCFAKLSDNDSAKDAYIKAIELDPYAFRAYVGLGTVALVKQSADIAVFNFQKAVSLAPQDEMANLGLGLAFHSMEERNEANSWISKTLEINPYNTVALFSLVKIAYETQQFEAAEAALKIYLKRHPNDHNMEFTLGGLQFKMGKFKEVVRLMKSVVKIDPLDGRAHSLLKQAERSLTQKTATSSNA